jgi:hypothetical protein
MRISLQLTVLSSLAALVASQTTGAVIDDASCSIDCSAVATCKAGQADYSGNPTLTNGDPLPFLAETSRDGNYCECPDGFTGLRCNRPYVDCNHGSDLRCYHGGKCVEELDTVENKTVVDFFCDCKTAEHNGNPFVGKYCEHKADLCGDGLDLSKFCVNDGTCKAGFETMINPCDCNSVFRGPHCEFEVGSVPECDLECEEGGQCRLGLKKYEQGIYDKYWARHDNFMTCECPDGYFGNTCDVKGIKCGDTHCFNDGKCIETITKTGDKFFSCDCAKSANEDESFGGLYCQSESTSFCTKGVDQNGQLFCTNGGTCKTET